MRVLGVITARGGSRGIPRKNVKRLVGKPLLQYTAEAALAADRLTDVVLSTDDPAIADLGHECGLTVPFLRPAELARDDTPSLPVVQHALRWFEDHGHQYDAACLLQPTTPLRRSESIDRCVAMLAEKDVDSVVTVLPVPAKYNPHWVFLQDAAGLLQLATGDRTPISRRQDLPLAWHREGSVYVTRRDVLLEQNSLYGQRVLGVPIDPEYSVNLDTPEDWERTERLIRELSVADTYFLP